MLSIPVVWSPDTRCHDPDGGIWVGVRIEDDEVFERVDRILDALQAAGAHLIVAEAVAPEALTSVHTPEMIEFLMTAWDVWEVSGYLDDPGMNRVVAYSFSHPDMRPTPSKPRSVSAWAGMFATDTMTLIGPGSWEAIVAAASAALGAADLVLSGEPFAYALTRPPGHHAGSSFFGGSCYVNNAALAAERLRTRFETVAIVDLDAHHGNGTQQIFWERGDVRYGSVHVDPGEGWFPHTVGYATETGGSAGSNRNLPIAPGSGDEVWLEAVDDLAKFATGCDALVVSLGVDAAEGDPESPLRVTSSGFGRAGQTLARLGVPTVVIQEGGYVLETIGGLVTAFLGGLEEVGVRGRT